MNDKSPPIQPEKLAQIADANVVEDPDDELRNQIQEQVDLVGPLLSEWFRRAGNSQRFHMNPRTTRTLADFIIGLQNMASVMEQQIQAMSETIAEQDRQLTALRPDRGIWVPGLEGAAE